MKRPLIIPGTIILAIAVWFVSRGFDPTRQNQFRCAGTAQKYLRSFNSDNPVDSQFSYTDHWNKKLGKCFIFTRTTTMLSAGALEGHAVVDVLENKTYGLMSTLAGSFQSCSILPAGDESSERPCTSEADFNTYIKGLMTE